MSETRNPSFRTYSSRRLHFLHVQPVTSTTHPPPHARMSSASARIAATAERLTALHSRDERVQLHRNAAQVFHRNDASIPAATPPALSQGQANALLTATRAHAALRECRACETASNVASSAQGVEMALVYHTSERTASDAHCLRVLESQMGSWDADRAAGNVEGARGLSRLCNGARQLRMVLEHERRDTRAQCRALERQMEGTLTTLRSEVAAERRAREANQHALRSLIGEAEKVLSQGMRDAREAREASEAAFLQRAERVAQALCQRSPPTVRHVLDDLPAGHGR